VIDVAGGAEDDRFHGEDSIRESPVAGKGAGDVPGKDALLFQTAARGERRYADVARPREV
jgi:hypothetical protein